ncbi:Thiol-disulfide oxidoreductase ResA, partial [Durusdinium trenchii]
PVNLKEFDGTARYVPAGSHLVFEMHYTPNGSVQTDRSGIAVLFAEPSEVRRQLSMVMVANTEFESPPHESNHVVESRYTFDEDSLLYSLSPHMHLRGDTFRFVAHYPDGADEILLDVPNFDFNWQFDYLLSEPKVMPKGTEMHCIATFNNSEDNIANPDADKAVQWGDQIWDEMMIGTIAIAPLDQDLKANTGKPLEIGGTYRWALVWICLLTVGMIGFVWIGKRAWRSVASVVVFAVLSTGLCGEVLAEGDSSADPRVGMEIEEFALQDFRGGEHALSDWAESPVVVVAFMGTECPLAKLYASRLVELAEDYKDSNVAVVAAFSNRQDSIEEMEHFARVYGVSFPCLKDVGNQVADQFQAQRTPEVYVLDKDRKVRYVGRVDDQYDVGVDRAEPEHRFLVDAVDALLDGEEVPVVATEARGCIIGRVLEADEAAEGDPSKMPPPAEFPTGWRLPREPDLVVPMSDEPFTVAADGVIEYQYFVADPQLTVGRFIDAAECRPDNHAVVHHINVFVLPPELDTGNLTRDDLAEMWDLQHHMLCGYVPGMLPTEFPEGMAKYVAPGSKFVFQMHYTPNGSVQQDLSSLGLVFAPEGAERREVTTTPAMNNWFVIPPNEPEHVVTLDYNIKRDTEVLSFLPHMHLRGKAFRYVAHYPDGTDEILLDVPHYDFKWQNRYVLAQPMMLPEGTVVECIATFDNSEDNLSNPDSTVEVSWGEQSWEEMMIGYFDVVAAEPEPSLAGNESRSALLYLTLGGLAVAAVVVMVVLALLTLVMFGVAAMAVLRVIELRREARAPAGPSLVQAERFILLDEQGNQRAVLGVGANEEAMLELNDSRGKLRLRMDVPSSGPGVTLRDDRGKVRALFTVYTDGPYLGMTDEDGALGVPLRSHQRSRMIPIYCESAGRFRSKCCLLLGALLAGLMLFQGFAAEADDESLANIVGQSISRFELQDFQGRSYALEDFDEHPVLVVAFLGVECPLAKQYASRLAAMSEEFVSQGVGFVGVDSNVQDSLEEIGHFARKHEFTFPLLRDRDHEVPAQGLLEYEYFIVDPGFTEDRWLKACECRPGNRSVVHHINVFILPPELDNTFLRDQLTNRLLDGYAPGFRHEPLPEGMASRVRAGSRFVFQMHYTPVGTPQEDLSYMGVIFADEEKVEQSVEMPLAFNAEFAIPPGASDHQVKSMYELKTDATLFAMIPHMHLRGKSFRYEALHIDGTTEVLLHVPRYDFNWQSTFQLSEPIELPAGTIVECTAVFDNSEDNLANPDPTATVTWGDQTTDEMMIGYLCLAKPKELGDLPNAPPQRSVDFAEAPPIVPSGLAWLAVAVALVGSSTALVFVGRRMRMGASKS